MLTRELFKTRQTEDGTAYAQAYRFALQEKYLKYRSAKKHPLHHYLREILFNGLPDVFNRPEVNSASRVKKYVAVEPMPKIDGGTEFVPVYNEREPSELIPYPVIIHKNSSHFFSQAVLESQAFVDKKFESEDGLTMPNAMEGHMVLQDFLLRNGIAEACEVPAWRAPEQIEAISLPLEAYTKPELYITCFMDALIYWQGRLWIYDYKPDALMAKNKHAVSQVLECRDLLHERTGIKDIGCAFGDEKTTIIVDV